MREHTRNVGTTKVTMVVQDSHPYQQQMAIVGKVVKWTLKARTCLTEAVAYTTLAMTRPALVHPIYWESLYYYFGLPLSDPSDGHYNNSLNKIRNALITTSNGLNGDFTVSDIEELSGMYGLLYRASRSEGKKDMGMVHKDLAEEIGNAARNLFGMSPPRVDGPQTRESHIYLNFEQLMPKKSWWGVVTLIHEATHKYARTIDAQYFNADDGDMWKMYTASISSQREMAKLLGREDSYIDRIEQARRAVTSRLGADALANIRTMPTADALNNADGLARYVHSVAAFPPWH